MLFQIRKRKKKVSITLSINFQFVTFCPYLILNKWEQKIDIKFLIKFFYLNFRGRNVYNFNFNWNQNFDIELTNLCKPYIFFLKPYFFYSPSDIERPMWYNVTTSSERRKVPILIFHFFFWKLKENCLRVHKVQFSFWIISHQIL